MKLIFCKVCHGLIAVRGAAGTKIPKEYKGKMKPINKDGIEKELCADCEAKQCPGIGMKAK